MSGQWLKFTAFWSIFLGIVLFCVLLGGYTSFWRSQSRIKTSKSFLTDACRERLDLLPGLVEMEKNCDGITSLPGINQAAKKADMVLQQVIAREKLLNTAFVTEFENSQIKLTLRLKDTLTQLETCLDKKYAGRLRGLRQQFSSAQDNLFMARRTYNDEVKYFNTRSRAFPTILIAKLFGFYKIKYMEISKDIFLPAHNVFTPKAS
ncbi:MAG: LemA family protein [Deltaproteobacteria bacterium]|nr:LemA family protein [Deltaproteobacteria bacterium]